MRVCRRDDHAIVGFVNIGEIVRGALESGFLGYGVVAAHAGRGYMTEGIQLVLARAFSELRLHRLEPNIQPREPRLDRARPAIAGSFAKASRSGT